LSEKLPQLKAREVIRALRKDGWILDRTKGSHQHFTHPSKHGTVTVAVHAGRDVSLRTVRSILTQAGLTEDELKELL
jgi:predicted RNA binding protein YcfA (HicA-like mRNA interferase family)